MRVLEEQTASSKINITKCISVLCDHTMLLNFNVKN
jgi:hypothetical protein